MVCVNSVSVYPKSVTIKLNSWYYDAYAEICPCEADCCEVTWHSEDPSIASVNADSGYIYANALGTTRIYATATDGSVCSDYIDVTVSHTVPVTTVILNRRWLSLERGHSYSLVATVFPNHATNKTLNWVSSNNDIVTVNDGVVTAVSLGSATITATAADGSGKSAICTITVTSEVLVSSITVEPSSTTMILGESTLLTAIVSPEDASNKTVIWSSDNTNVITVNEDSGLVTAQSDGEAIVYATSCDGNCITGSCSITVNRPILINRIDVSPDTLSLNVGETATLSAEAFPENAKNKTIRWVSDDESIAEVGLLTGCVTAKKSGSTNIYAKAQDGSGVRGCCKVTVNEIIVEETVLGLKTIKQCRVRKDMSMDDSAILKDSSGANVKLNIGETVPLLSTTTISANGRVWYRILHNGMMLHVTADDESFEEITIPVLETPIGTSVTVHTGGVNLNVRCTPATSYTELGKFSNGTNVVLTNTTPQTDTSGTDWYAVYGQATNGAYLYGWCSGEYLGNYVEYGTLVDVDTLTIRSRAGTGYTSLGTIIRGNTVEILEKNCAIASGYTWHKILYNGSEGYVVAGNNTPNFTFETRWVALTTTTNDNNENIDVSTLTPVSGNRYLTQSEMKNNALIIYDYLRNKIETPWSKNAICALLGNMQAESTINPGRWQSGVGPGYGLVQWDPASKWLEWATTNNYAEDSLFGQLRKILNEVEMDGVGVWDDSVHQWQKFRVTPEISFKNFTQSNKSVNELSTIFLKCYERPRDQSASVISYRQELCTNWLNYINSFNLK